MHCHIKRLVSKYLEIQRWDSEALKKNLHSTVGSDLRSDGVSVWRTSNPMADFVGGGPGGDPRIS